ncbi:Arabinanase/levansucrase/invertase superfamily protein [Mycena sanguinolenta]|uniref:Arabinanase/levansucrase/invertase superfamily protein n=1 Tax=Mycena sanguinolenta TaxID=230812 RepID=A0A8H6XZX3_9AGAR|nr:Arabinanase/levansucrase/invertase superfamily protein [Mycena sanguinolenta]
MRQPKSAKFGRQDFGELSRRGSAELDRRQPTSTGLADGGSGMQCLLFFLYLPRILFAFATSPNEQAPWLAPSSTRTSPTRASFFPMDKRRVSTSSVHGKVPYRISEDFVEWTVQGDALPNPRSWVDSSNSGIWAPDVRQITSNSYVMYYTAFSTADGNHCIGAATSSTPAGPFTPQLAPILCDSAGGGVIDASGFEAPGGALYLVWKVDGNSKGLSTPIFIQPLAANGYTLTGSATQLITHEAVDGYIVEAPSMVYWEGWYYLYALGSLAIHSIPTDEHRKSL